MFELDPISTTDLITIASILMTAFFSLLIWRATISSNKIARAIEDSNKKEKASIHAQNRYLVKYNLGQIQYELSKHNETIRIGKEGRKNIRKALLEIEDSNLSQFFNTNEIVELRGYLNYMNVEFEKKILKSRAVSFDPKQHMELAREYNTKEIPTINEAKEKVSTLIKLLK